MRDGERLGPYRIVGVIGAGGMGAVYRAEHTLIGRQAAIKVLLPALSTDRVSVDRFFNEARATTKVTDPGIVQVFDYGVAENHSAYIVMELLEGEPLDKRLDKLGVLQQQDALRIVRQVAGSLAAAHAAGIVHRDLKPENLFMVRDADAPGGERPKILDFGIAKLGDNAPDRVKTRTGAVLGTPVYMSPEQCSGAGAVDHRADIYALGCVLFHLVIGKPPFDLPGIGDIISAHLRELPPSPRELAPSLLPEVEALILRCLAKQPDQRFQTMLDLQRACDEILARITSSGARTVALPSGSHAFAAPYTDSLPAPRTTLSLSAIPIATSPRKRRVGLWAGLFAVAAAAGILLAVIAHRRDASADARPQPESAAAPAPSDPAPMPSDPAPAPVPSDPAPAPVPDPEPADVPTAVPAPSEPAPVAQEPVAASPDPASAKVTPTKRPTKTKKATKPAKRDNDLYDDR